MSSARPRRYIALLRGINLGARNRVPMARLREICEEAGCSDVKTYIASGNIVCTSSFPAETLRHRLEAAIDKEFSISIAVVVMTAPQLAAVIKRNPFPDAEPTALYVAFASGPIGETDTDRLEQVDFRPEEIAVRGNLVYLLMPTGYGRSHLAAEVSRVKVPTTVRNWRTVTALNEMATIRS